MLKKDIRQEKILTYLSHSGRVSISELCTMFDIVPMTARRDLKELEDAHKLIRTIRLPTDSSAYSHTTESLLSFRLMRSTMQLRHTIRLQSVWQSLRMRVI